MIYYTSDLHFGHEKIIRYENRPFETVEEMNEKLIENWNSVVTDEDTVYHLGDFAVKNSKMTIEKIMEIYHRLNGKKILIIGNHDTNWIGKVADQLDYKPALYTEIKDGDDIVDLMHYPIEDWDGKQYGTIHLHGHNHSRDIITHLPNRFNVGVDVRDYKPVTLEELKNSESIF